MILGNGQAKLLDFGCARDVDREHTMTVMLKHGFVPIEQYTGYNQGPWTDVYAMCATFYHCLTGQMPPRALERMAAQDPLIPPNRLGAALTPEPVPEPTPEPAPAPTPTPTPTPAPTPSEFTIENGVLTKYNGSGGAVTIPDSVIYIGRYAFWDCTRMSDVYYGGSAEQWKLINFNHANEPLLRASIHYGG